MNQQRLFLVMLHGLTIIATPAKQDSLDESKRLRVRYYIKFLKKRVNEEWQIECKSCLKSEYSVFVLYCLSFPTTHPSKFALPPSAPHFLD
jgi:hypothetical protein